MKVDATGELLWERIFREDYPLDCYPSNVPLQQTSDGGYIVGGRKDSTGVWLIKTDSLGFIDWQRTYLGQLVADVRSIQQTTDGGYVATGAGASSWLSPNREDVYLMRTDSVGNIQWKRTFGGSKSDCGVCVRQTLDLGYIVAGLTNSFGTNDLDAYILRTDSTGTLRWVKTLGDFGHEARSIEQTQDGGYVLVCWTYNPDVQDVQMEIVKLAPDSE